MSALDQVRALYEYNEWANNHVLDAASALAEDELARELGASFGSVQGNLQHIVWAQTMWLARWTGAKPARLPAPEPGQVMDALGEAFDISHQGIEDFVRSLTEDALSTTVSYVDTEGRPQQRVLWQAMLHVANHGTHHRAETALLLTALGRPPRQLDYVFFEIERAGGEPRLT